MTKKRKIGKTDEQMLRDCEAHLYFLWDAHRLYQDRKEHERFKQIAAELRLLVCETHTNKPLLLNLMEKYGFFYDVQPPGPPFDKQPIAMVGSRQDPEHQKLSKLADESLGHKERIEQFLGKQALLRRPVPLKEFVNEALAVYIRPYDYSSRDLTLAIAQQMGSSHEDTGVDEPIVQMQKIVIGANQGHIAPLIGFAELVIRAGSMFLGFLVQNDIYEPKHFRRDSFEHSSA